jgi:hypothetical protein
MPLIEAHRSPPGFSATGLPLAVQIASLRATLKQC